MKVRYVPDGGSLVGCFSIEAENEMERTILTQFVKATETGWRIHQHSSVYECDYSAITKLLIGVVKEGEMFGSTQEMR